MYSLIPYLSSNGIRMYDSFTTSDALAEYRSWNDDSGLVKGNSLLSKVLNSRRFLSSGSGSSPDAGMGIHPRKMKSAKAIDLMEGNRIANPNEEYGFAVGMLLVSKEREDGRRCVKG